MSNKCTYNASAETPDVGTDAESGGAVPFVLDEGSELGEVVLGSHPEDPIQTSEYQVSAVPIPVLNDWSVQADISSAQNSHARSDIAGTSAARSKHTNSITSSKDDLTYAEQSVTDTDSEVDWLSTELARRDELIEQLSEYVYKLWNANDSLFADYESQETALTDRLRVLRARLHDATQTLRQSTRKEGAPQPTRAVPLELMQTIQELAQGIHNRLNLLDSSCLSQESNELQQSAIELLSSLKSCKVDQVDPMCRRFFQAIIAMFEIGPGQKQVIIPFSSTYELEEKARQSEQEVARLSSLVRDLHRKLESIKSTFSLTTADSADVSMHRTPVCNTSFSFAYSSSPFPVRSDTENPVQAATEPASSHPQISHTRPECYVEVESWTGETNFGTSILNGGATHNVSNGESLTVCEAESNSIAVIANPSPLTERGSIKFSELYTNHDSVAGIPQQPQHADYDALSPVTCHQPCELSSDLISGSGRTMAPVSTAESSLVLRPILKRPASLPRVSVNKSKISWYDELDTVCDRLWNVMDRLQQAISISVAPVSEEEKSPGLGSVTSRLESLVQIICDTLAKATQGKMPESEGRPKVPTCAVNSPLAFHRLMAAQKIQQDVRALRVNQTELLSQANYCFGWMKDQLRYINQSLLMLPENVNASSDIMRTLEQGVQGIKDQSSLCNAVYPSLTVSSELKWPSGDSVSALAPGFFGTGVLVDKCVRTDNDTQHLDSVILTLRSENGSLQAQLNAANSEIDTLTSYLMKVKREIMRALPTKELNWFHDRPESLEFQVIPELVCCYVRWSQNSLEAYSTQLEHNNTSYTQLQRELDAAHNQLGSVQHMYRALDARYLRTTAELSNLKKHYKRQAEGYRGGVLSPNAHTIGRLHNTLRPDSTDSVTQSTPGRSELGDIECEMASHYNNTSESPKNKLNSSFDSLLLTTTSEYGSGWHQQQIAEHRPNRWPDLDDMIHDTDTHTHPMCSWPQSNLSAPVQEALTEAFESTTTTNTDELLTKLEHKEHHLKAIKQELELMSKTNVELQMQVQALTDEAAKLQFVKQQLQTSEQNKLQLQQHVQALQGLLTQQLTNKTTTQNSLLPADLGGLNYFTEQVAQLGQAKERSEHNTPLSQSTEAVNFEQFTQQWVSGQEVAQERLQSLEQECQCLREVNTRLIKELKFSQEQLARSHNEHTKLQFDYANLQIAYQTTRNQLEEYTVTLTQHLESLRSRNVTVDKQVFTDGLYSTVSADSFPNDLSTAQQHHCSNKCSELAMSNELLSRQLQDAFDQLSTRLEALGHRDKQLADLRLVLRERDEELSCLKRELKFQGVERQTPSKLLTEATSAFYPDAAEPQANLPRLLSRVEASEPTPNEVDALLRCIEAAERDRDRFIQAFQQSEATVHTLRTQLTLLASQLTPKAMIEVQLCAERVAVHSEPPDELAEIETPPVQKRCTLSTTNEFVNELSIAEHHLCELDISKKSLHLNVESVRANLEGLRSRGDTDDSNRASIRVPSDVPPDCQKNKRHSLTTEQHILIAELPMQRSASFNFVDFRPVPRPLSPSERRNHNLKSPLFTAHPKSVTDVGYSCDRQSGEHWNLPEMKHIKTTGSLDGTNIEPNSQSSHCYVPVDAVVVEFEERIHAPRRFSEGHMPTDSHVSAMCAQFSSPEIHQDRLYAMLAERDSEFRNLKYMTVKVEEVHELQQKMEKLKSPRHVDSSSMTEVGLVSSPTVPFATPLQDSIETETGATAEICDSSAGTLDNRGSYEADAHDEPNEMTDEQRPSVENKKETSTLSGWSKSQDCTVNKSHLDAVTQKISLLNRDVSSILMGVLPLLDALKDYDMDVRKMCTVEVGEVAVDRTPDDAGSILNKTNHELFLLSEKITHLSHCCLKLVQLCPVRIREWSNKCYVLERQVSMMNEEKVLLQKTLDAAISPPVRRPIARAYESKSGVNPVLANNEPDDVIEMPSIGRSWNIVEAPVPPKHLSCARSQWREQPNQWEDLFEDSLTEQGTESHLHQTAKANVLDVSLHTDERTGNHKINEELIQAEPPAQIRDLSEGQVAEVFDVGNFLHPTGSGRIRRDRASYHPSGCSVDSVTHSLQSEQAMTGIRSQTPDAHTITSKEIGALAVSVQSDAKDERISLKASRRATLQEGLEADNVTMDSHQQEQYEIKATDNWNAGEQILNVHAQNSLNFVNYISQVKKSEAGSIAEASKSYTETEMHYVTPDRTSEKLRQIEKHQTKFANMERVTQLLPPKAPKHLSESTMAKKMINDFESGLEKTGRVLRTKTKGIEKNKQKVEREQLTKPEKEQENLHAIESGLCTALEKIEQLECEKCELQSDLLSRSQVADRGRLLDNTVVDLVDAKKLLGELVGQLSELRASYVHGLSERASLESTLRDALCNLTDVELQLSVNTRHGEELRDALTESEMACAEARAAASRQACDLLEVTDRLKCSELAREALSVRVADQQKVLVCMAGELRHVRDVLCGVGAELRTLGLECKCWQSSGASELGQCVCTVDSLVETSQKLYSESASRLIEMESLVCDLREELRVACAPVCASEGALREELCALRSEYARVCEAVASSEAMCVEKSCALTAATDRVSELSAELSVVRRRVRELSSENEALLSELFDASTHFAEFSSLLSMFCPCLSSSISGCLLPLGHPSNDGYRGVFSSLLHSSEGCFFRSHSCLPSPVAASDVGLVSPVLCDIFADVTRLSRVCSTLVVAALRLANLVEQVTPISFRLSDRLSVDIPPSSSVPLVPEVCWSASSLCRASKDLEREAAVLAEQLNLELSCNHNLSEEVERMKSVNSSWIACAHRILDTVNDLCGSKSQCTFEGDLQPDDFEHSLSSAFKEFSGHLYQSALLDNECNSLRLRLLDLQEAHATSTNELQRAQATLNDQDVEIGRYRKHWRCLIDLTDRLIPLISSDTVTTDSLLQLRQGLHEIQNSLVNYLLNQTNDPVLAHFPALAEDSPVTIAPVAARHLELVDAECLAGVGAVPATASSSVLQQLPDEDAASLASSYRTSLEVSLSSEFNYLKNCTHSLKTELNSMRKYVEASLSSVRDELCSVIRLHDPSNTRSESLLIPSIVVEYIRKLHTIFNLNEFVPNADTKLDRISISPTYLCELSKQVSLLQQEVCFTKRGIQTSTSNLHLAAYKPDEIATSLGKFGYSPDPSATCNHTDESVSSESKLEILSAFVYACNVLIDYAPTTATGKLLEQVGVTRELIQFLNGILGKMESLCTLANIGNQESTHPASAHSNGLCISNEVPENILLLDFCARLAVLFDQPTIPLQPINSTDLKTHLSALFSAIQLQKQIFDEVRNTDEFRTAAYTGLINCLDQLCCMSDPKIILLDPHFSSNALSPQSLERLTELIRKGGLKSEDFIPRLRQLHQNVSNLALRISSLTDEDHELSAALRSKEMVFSVPGTVIRDLADNTQSVQSAVEALSTVLDRVDASKLRTGMGDAIHDAQTTGSKTVTSLRSNNQQTTSYLELTVAVDALHKEWTQLKRTLISFERGLEHESVSRLKRGTTVLDTSCEESHVSCANVPSTDDTVQSPLNVSLPTLDVRWPILTCNTHQVLDNPSSISQLCTVPQERRMSTTNLLASALNLQGWNAKSWPSIHRRAYKKQLPHRSHSLPALRRHSCSPPFVEDPRPTADDIEAIWNERDKKLFRRASEATLSHHPTVYRSSLLQFVRALEAYFPAFMLRPIGISLFPLSLRTGLRTLRHLLLTLPEDLIRPISISDVSDCLECHVQWRELQLWQKMRALRAQLVLLHRQMKLEQASHRSPSELQAQIGQIHQILCQSTLSYKFVHELMPLRIPLHPGGPYCHLLAANVSSDLSTDCEQYGYFGLSATLVQRLLRLLHIRDMEVLYLLSLRQEGGQLDHEHEEICTKLRTFADWNSIPPVDLTELPTYRIGLRMLDSKLFSQLEVSAEEKKRVAESFDFPLNRKSNDPTQQHLSDQRHLSSYETLLDCVRRCEHTLSQIQQCLDPRSTFPTNVDVDQLTLPLAQLQSLLRSRKQQTETHVESVTLYAPSTASLTNSPSYPRRSVRPPILNLINAVDHMVDLTELRNLCKHLFDQYRIVSSELELQLDTNWCLRQRLIATNATIDQLSKQLNEEHHSLAYLEQRLNVETEKHTALTEQCDVARVHGRTAVRKLEHLLTGEEQRAIQADSLQEAPVLPTDTTFVSGVAAQAVCGLHGERPPSYLGESRESYHALSASTPLKHSVSSQTTKTSKFSCLPRPMMSCGTARKRSPSSSATPTRTPYRSTKRHQMSLNVPGSSSQVAVQRHRCKPVSSLPSDSTPSLIKRQTNNSNLSCLDPSPAMSSTECISLTTRSIITPDTSAESSESTRLLTDWSFSSVDTQPSGHSLPSAGAQEQSDCSTPAKRPKRSKRLIRLLRHRMFPKTDLKKQS